MPINQNSEIIGLQPTSKGEQGYVNSFLQNINDISDMNAQFLTSMQARRQQTDSYGQKLLQPIKTPASQVVVDLGLADLHEPLLSTKAKVDSYQKVEKYLND